LKNSQILADAIEGMGGNINITTQGFQLLVVDANKPDLAIDLAIANAMPKLLMK
jgi:hypothetical protein